MKLGKHNRITILGIGLFLAAAFLMVGFHHHDHDETCWFCVSALAALLPLIIVAIAQALPTQLTCASLAQLPAWFTWVVHHYRGPPSAYEI